MDCQQVHLRVYEYLDGEMTMWQRRAVARHLEECPPCADCFTFELRLRTVVVAKCTENPPAELQERIAQLLGVREGGDLRGE